MYERKKIKIYNKDSFDINGGTASYPLMTIFEYMATQAEFENENNWDKKIITNMIGWDDTSTSIEINTEPLLLQSGSAIISKRLAEREVTLEYSASVPEPKYALSSESNIRSAMMNLESLVITRENLPSDDTRMMIEALFECYVTSFEVKRDNPTEYTVKIVFKVLKPVKRAYYQMVGDSYISDAYRPNL